MKITDKKIIKTVIIDCSIDTVWWKWTTHEGLLTFMCKDNKVELVPGGAYEIYFLLDNPPGLRGGEGCTVLSYIPKQMFSFTWNAPPILKEARESGYYTWVVVDFKKISENQTEVTLTHFGFPEGKIWDEVHEYFTTAWDKVMEWLVDSVK